MCVLWIEKSIGWPVRPDAVRAGRNPSCHPEDQITLEVLTVWSCQYKCSCQSNIRVAVKCADAAEQRENTAELLCSRHVINCLIE